MVVSWFETDRNKGVSEFLTRSTMTMSRSVRIYVLNRERDLHTKLERMK